MKKLAKGLCPPLAAIAILILALPAMAAAEYLVPPGNSAATQYTETVPTAGGHRDAEKNGKGSSRSPASVLGDGNARRLDEQGSEGREVAEFAAETAPEETAEEAAAPRSTPNGGAGDSKTRKQQKKDRNRDKAAEQDAKPDPAATAAGGSPPPDGSSGLLEVIAEATGASSTGQVGVLLPLAILATLAWALAFLWRRNRPTV